jgi:hypothetical protein
MTGKMLNDLIDIYCIGENGTQKECLDWIKTLKVHEILDINSDLFENFALVAFIVNVGDLNSLVIHIMMREPDRINSFNRMEYLENVEYLSTIVLNKRARCEAIYDWQKIYNGRDFTSDFKEDIESTGAQQVDPIGIAYRSAPNFDTEVIQASNFNNIIDEVKDEIIMNNYHFYKYYYIEFGDNQYVQDYISNYTPILDSQMLQSLEKCISGLWFNINDIRWQFALRSAILHNSNYTINILNFNYRYFEFVNVREHYLKNQGNSKDVWTQRSNENLVFECDICRAKLDKYGFSNINVGELCQDCYFNKKKQFITRIKYLKKLALLPGKRIVFQKMLTETKKHLQKGAIKSLETGKLNTLTKNVIKEINKFNHSGKGYFSECPICLDHMDKDDILFGGCGHCFHTRCVLSLGENKCPVCRDVTVFKKLYL